MEHAELAKRKTLDEKYIENKNEIQDDNSDSCDSLIYLGTNNFQNVKLELTSKAFLKKFWRSFS